MFEFISNYLFWVFLCVVAISNAVKGFFSIYHRESHTSSDILIIVLSVINIAIYIASFILTGWVSTVVLLLVGSTVGGFVAADTKHRLAKNT